jgi:hypothetical protein
LNPGISTIQQNIDRDQRALRRQPLPLDENAIMADAEEPAAAMAAANANNANNAIQATTSDQKFHRYHAVIKLVTGLLTGISSLLDPSDPADERRYLEDFESSATYSATSDGFLKYQTFHIIFKRGLGTGTARARYDEVIRRPHVQLAYNAAEADNNAYMSDLMNDTPEGQAALQPGNYATTYWPLFRAEFLGQEKQPWHKSHTSRFEKKNASQGTDTVSKYYETKFMMPGQTERISENWPMDAPAWTRFTNLHDAHSFFANL